MKLTHYNVTIEISDPANPESKVTTRLANYGREALLRLPLIGDLVEDFERDRENNGNGGRKK